MSKPLRKLLLATILCAALGYVYFLVPFNVDMLPADNVRSLSLPLDADSPWPKFRANALQNGRVALKPVINPAARPWTFQTGKGVFSSAVIDKEGTVYIGSADQRFYAIDRTGNEKWHIQTGGVIDSSALLDDDGRVFFGSGDGQVYAARRDTGEVLWRFKAHTPAEARAVFGVKSHNVNWFEGNIGLLPDGTLLAPNDNNIVYALDRDGGARKTQYLGNEMVWSLPAVNAASGRLFFGTTNLALRTFFSYEITSGRREWVSGGLGSIAATSLLTSSKANGGVVVGGFDGYLRAYKQSGGQQVWKAGLRDHIYASPAQLSKGPLIQPAADGTVYAIDPTNGHTVWAFDTLNPIRSSPAVDGNDVIYVGSGEGRLFAINPDGTLRWAYQWIDEVRNDLNSSPALGAEGVVIGGENGGVFFTPHDYCLGEIGKRDSKCVRGSKEELPADGAYLLSTNVFSKPVLTASEAIDANQPLTFSLFVRAKGRTQLAALDSNTLQIEVKDDSNGNPDFTIDVSAQRRVVTLTPRTVWTAAAGGKLTVIFRGSYSIGLSRFGLKFFGGHKGGEIDGRHEFMVRPRASESASTMPFAVPNLNAGRSTVFEASRLSLPNPTMLPSWNQIGFDSLHYLMGTVSGHGNSALLWVVSGKRENGATVVDPSQQVRYPLLLTWDGGLVTLTNDDGFKINFFGSWDMPFASYRISAKADASGRIIGPAAFSATELCDDIAFYGRGFKLMGLSDFDTGKMNVVGGLNLGVWKQLDSTASQGFRVAEFDRSEREVNVRLRDSTLKADAHVYSLLVTDARDHPLPLYYTHNTHLDVDATGVVTGIRLTFDATENVGGEITARFMIDTYPAAQGILASK
jgi:outer membrane protein assembly factor BamB